MRHKSMCAGALLGMIACLAMVMTVPVIGSDRTKEKLRYKVEQVQQSDLSAIFLTDQESHETISIVNGARHGGAFIAFYEPNAKSAVPRLAISSQGLQIRQSNGHLRFVSVDDLAQIGEKRTRPIEQAHFRMTLK